MRPLEASMCVPLRPADPNQVNGGKFNLRQVGPGEVVKGSYRTAVRSVHIEGLVAEAPARQKLSGLPGR
jgi:hypothetical protein